MPRSQTFLDKVKEVKIDWLIAGPLLAYALLVNILLFVKPEDVSLDLLLVLGWVIILPAIVLSEAKNRRINWAAVRKWLQTNGPLLLVQVVAGTIFIYLLAMFFLSGIE